MRRHPHLFIFLLTFVLLAQSKSFQSSADTSATAQDSTKKSDQKWDVTAAHADTQHIRFDTDEGTWIALDVSPDGKSLVFDLLGDIYTMPISGGEATLIAGGPAYEVQPRFSPDGKRISFTSDRDGCDNIWTMTTDGKNPKQITREKERQTNNAVWTPDGKYIVARKHYRNTRSLGSGEMWMYHVGGGDGLQLTKRRNWEQDAGEPDISPDGRYLFYSEDVSSGGGFQYNKDPYGVIYVIHRLDLTTGKSERVCDGAGGSVRPQVSPDGKRLAFVRRSGLKSVLMIQDLESGNEEMVFDDLSRDAQETWAIFGVHPGFSWTPDGKQIVISAKGRIWKIDVAAKTAVQIPFTARVDQTVTEALHFPREVAPESFEVKVLRWTSVAPDQNSVLYSALGKLWTRALPEGTPKRLTSDEKNFEIFPSFSRDGRWIVYATWNDEDRGAIWKISSTGGKPVRLTTRTGHYIEPTFSPDGKRIAYRRVGGDNLRGETFSRDQGVYTISADGGTPELVTEEGIRPTFSKDGARIFLLSNEGDKTALVSVGLKGERRRVHLLSENAQQIVPSPDEQWVAIVERFNAYVAVFPQTGQAVSIGPNSGEYPLRRISRDAGTYLNWSADGKKIFWSLGPELYSRELQQTFAFVEGAPDSINEKPDTAGINISFRSPSHIPEGSIALVGATVISMKGDEVIENATILVEGNRIKQIGAGVSVPTGVRTIDVRGKYVMPGLIDVHAHIGTGSNNISPQANWQFQANLAFGVTTAHDPSTNTEMFFASSELARAGMIVAPRLYSTGTILYGAEAPFKAVVNSLDDALSHLRRLKAYGAFSVKSYNQPRRDQRQQIIEAARALHMLVVPEGGSTFFWNMSMILDGHTGIEHSIPVSPMYKDALTLLSRSGTAYTPTLIVGYGGLWGENYWYMKTNVWENERLMRFTPRDVIDPRSRRRMMAAEEDFNYIENARSAKDALRNGANIQLGAHGQLQGLGAHWELWMFVQGGMTPLEAIRCATLNGAKYLGMEKDLGSLEGGKLADLIVMDKSPLENIRNSESIRYVMVNGRLFDGSTLDETGNVTRKRPKFYWE